MSELKATRGPWSIESKHGREGARGHWLLADGAYVAMACVRHSVGQEDANAHLIASAPDLYEALGRIIENTDSGAIQDRYVEAARAAMRKARGEV